MLARDGARRQPLGRYPGRNGVGTEGRQVYRTADRPSPVAH
jgi:hypothetical protein